MSFWETKRVVVIGGAGNIGSFVVESLCRRGARVRVLDNLESGSLDFLEQVRDAIEFVEGDTTDLDFCREAIRDADAVLNLAAQAPGVGHSHRNHVSLLGRNTQIGAVVLEACRAEEVGRVLMVSSSCVYPDDAPVPTPELPLFRGEPERVNSGYGWAKRFQELQAAEYAGRFGMSIAIARPFNAYGPRDVAKGERSHVIPALIERILSDEPELTVWGDGSQTRSFIHTRDLAEALLLLTERHAVCEAVNLGSDREVSMARLAELLMEAADTRKPIVFDTTKPTGCRRKAADMSTFRRLFGKDIHSVPLEEGLAEMVEAHRRHFTKQPA